MTELQPPAPPVGVRAPDWWDLHAPDEPPDLEPEPEPKKVYPPRVEVRKLVTGRAARFLRGEISIDDLDDEELARGQFRDRDGRFRGHPSSIIPRQFHTEMVRRLLERGTEKFREDFFAMIDVVIAIAKDEDVDAGVRLKAADMAITRLAGKPVDRVEMSVAIKPWEQTLVGIIRSAPQDVGEMVVVEDDEEGE